MIYSFIPLCSRLSVDPWDICPELEASCSLPSDTFTADIFSDIGDLIRLSTESPGNGAGNENRDDYGQEDTQTYPYPNGDVLHPEGG